LRPLRRVAELGSFGGTTPMSTSPNKFTWRRGFAVLLGLFALFVFIDAAMMVVEEFPKRFVDRHAEHWWSDFILGVGLTFVVGCVALWGALRLWRSRSPLQI